jgi:DNA-binding GntR family transcriptional regulator
VYTIENHINSKIYAEILARIISGEFRPGQRLIEEELAAAYDVSRTPIREILFALERDGLVERSRNRGARVVAFTPDDVEEIYEIRKALECLAVRSSVKNLPLKLLLDLERRLAALSDTSNAGWNEAQAELDFELHDLIVSDCRNRRLSRYLKNIGLLLQSLRLLGYRNDQHARRAGEDHLEIVRTLLRRDGAKAARLLADHIERSKHNALELFFLEQDGNNLLASAAAPEPLHD